MHAIFIILHIVAAIAVAFVVVGIVSILKGLVFKLEKNIKTGTIITAIAVFFLFSMHSIGKMHRYGACQKNCDNMEMRCGDMDFDNCMMTCDSTVSNDSLSGECKMNIEKKIIIKDHKACDPSMCDTSMCKKKCEHE